MMSLSALATQFETLERSAGVVLDSAAVLAQVLAATRFHAGFATLSSQPLGSEPITGATDVTHSEWALIRPLFMLYIERETCLQLEASRGLGLDVFGRSSGEIAGDITQAEAEYPKRAFYSPVITI